MDKLHLDFVNDSPSVDDFVKAMVIYQNKLLVHNELMHAAARKTEHEMETLESKIKFAENKILDLMMKPEP